MAAVAPSGAGWTPGRPGGVTDDIGAEESPGVLLAGEAGLVLKPPGHSPRHLF
ncbi:MAG: hypothetical protein KJZ69_11855 [Phycisphaerales bacterium]|nr:hypothetical protein [Phycisphaerales bacterium]